MKYLLLTICLFLLLPVVKAHTVKGKISGMKNGETVYLLTHPDNTIEHKWSLSQVADSCIVKDGKFEFTVPDAAVGRLWLLRVKGTPLKYYFNRNEDICITGTLGSFSLFDEKVTGGHSCILLEDIFSILDEAENPIERRDGTEWLMRHAGEDAGLFATAYFYLEKKILRALDVQNILSEVPEDQKSNPYYRLISDYYQKDVLVQPGQPLPAKSLSKSGQPQIICYCRSSKYGQAYIQKLKELLPLQESIPDLQYHLIYPEFPEEITAELQALTAEKPVQTTDYATAVAANPALFYDANSLMGCILVDGDGTILAVNPQKEECTELINTSFQEKGFVINGYVLGLDDGIAELVLCKKGTLSVPEIVDSVVIRNGYFTFRGKVPYPQYCNIGIRGTAFPVGFYLENSPIDVNIKIGQGTGYHNGIPSVIKALRGKVYGSVSQKENQHISLLGSPENIEAWIAAHPANMPTLMCLATSWVERYPPDLVEKWLNRMDKSLSDRLAYQEALKQIAKHRELAMGAPAPAFTLPSDKGKQIALKDFRGKYVLLDFWASWCGPCRGEIPNLKKAWTKYHPKGLEIVSITIDRKEDDWRKALAEEQMPWTQLNGRGSKISEQYNVQGIPHILLIDRKGKIVGINLRGEKLEEKLQELFAR